MAKTVKQEETQKEIEIVLTPKELIQQKISIYKEKVKHHQETKNGLEEKRKELEAKLGELSSKLSKQQRETLSDISAESLLKDQSIKNEITQAELLLSAVKERQDKISFPTEINEIRKEAFSQTIKEAVKEYDDKLPALLREIEASKKQYLQKLVEYHSLKTGVNKKIIEAARELDTTAKQDDFPYLKEVAWHYYDHPHADGCKYTVASWDINEAVHEGKIR